MNIYFILVKPAVPENIGAAARAIKTMGFSRLRIVGSDQHLAKKAHILAHGATDILNSAQSFESLSAAVDDIDWVIGTSAKRRLGKRYSYRVDELEPLVVSKTGAVGSIAIVFGCEESGLSNADLNYCDALSYIPIAQKYPSLNLGQAVMIFAYSLREISIQETDISNEVVDKNSLAVLKNKVGDFLLSLNLDTNDKLYNWAMERLTVFTAIDIKFLHLLLRKIEGTVRKR